MDFAISHEEHRARYARLQGRMEARGLDAFLCWTPENIYYLTGFHTLGYYFPQCLVVPAAGDPTLVVRDLETPNVEALTWLTAYRGYRDHEDAVAAVAGAVARAARRIGIESESSSLSPARYSRLTAALEERAVPTTGLVEEDRVVKSPAEIDLIRRSARFTEAGLTAAFDQSRIGHTEDDVAGAVYKQMISRGSSYPSLAPFITSGPQSALPHATWSGRPLQAGDVLFYEVGGSAGRYGSGLIRVGVIGELPPGIRATVERAVSVVTEVLHELIAAIRPGITGHDVNRAGRTLMEASGWGDLNRNRSGYSIGVSFPPGWGEGHIFSLREGEHRPLQPGMVFHLVPNLFFPHVCGIAVSDMVLVTASGCEPITQFPHDLVVVDQS